MIKFQGVFREFSVISGAAILGQIVSLLISFFIAKQLGAGKFGEYSYIIALTSLGPILYGLGIPNAIYRFYNTAVFNEYKIKVVSSGLFVVLISSLILSITLFFVISNIHFKEFIGYELRIVSLTFLLSLNNLLNVILRASRDYKVTSLLSISQPFIKAVLISGLFFSNSLKISSLLLILIVIEFFSLTIIIFFIRDKISAKFICHRTVREMFRYGYSFIPHKLLAKGQDPLIKNIVLNLFGTEALGVYALGQKLALPFGFLIDKFQFIWGPLKFNIKNKSKDSYEIFKNISNSYISVINLLSSAYALFLVGVIQLGLIQEYRGIETIALLFVTMAALRGNYYMYGTGAEFGKTMIILPFISGGYILILLLFKFFGPTEGIELNYIFLPLMLAELYSIITIRYYSKSIFFFPIKHLTIISTMTLVLTGLLYTHFNNWFIFVFSGLFYAAFILKQKQSLRNTFQILNDHSI